MTRGLIGGLMKSSTARAWEPLLDRKDVLILDTETTGFEYDSELVEIAIMDTAGATVYDKLVMPQGKIPLGASRVHGLTRDLLARNGALPWTQHYEAVKSIVLAARVIYVYNLEYDERIIEQTCDLYDLEPILSIAEGREVDLRCSMLEYAAHRKAPGRYGDYRWHKLKDACRHESVSASQDHRALSDCRMVLNLMRAVAR